MKTQTTEYETSIGLDFISHFEQSFVFVHSPVFKIKGKPQSIGIALIRILMQRNKRNAHSHDPVGKTVLSLCTACLF
jgi:hypothetical protein